MDQMKMRFTDAVAAKLAAAPQSTAKEELIEELSDNLYRRFLDMTGAGLEEEAAFERAMEDLGDVDELLGYLVAEQDVPQDGQDKQGDVHIHYDDCAGEPQSDLDAILANVSEICRIAMGQARDAVRQARDEVKRRAAGRRDKVVIYGFGYDKAQGGFFTPWGDWKGGEARQNGETGQPGRGPHFTGEDSYMEGKDGGSWSVTALKDLRGLEVYTTSGDVTIHVSEAPDAGVIIDGDVDDLDVTCSADGVLTIREGRTASSSCFSRRGFLSADVELYIPRRHWESIDLHTVSGDVEIGQDGLDIDRLTVQTANGDLSVRLRSCSQLRFKSASGDLDLSGACESLKAETASGDITLRGQIEDAALKSASGDIELEGLVSQFRGSTMSGDVRLETSRLPQAMEMSSKSGDLEARIPDSGPFSVQSKTVSGDITSDFFEGRISTRSFSFNFSLDEAADDGPVYRMETVSGDVSLRKF